MTGVGFGTGGSGSIGSLGILQIPEGGFDATQGPMAGSAAHGKVDLIALGLASTATPVGEAAAAVGPLFVVEPAEGVLQPGEVLDVGITFLPSDSAGR